MAEFEFTEEQRDMRALVRTFCADAWPETEVRRLMDTPEGFDREVWRRLGGDLGILGLAVPEEYGGEGRGIVDLAIIAEECGRVVACSPFLSTVALSATALLHSADEGPRKALLTEIITGQKVVALAATDASGQWQPANGSVTAAQVSDGWTLTGAQSHVIDGAAADALLVLAQTPSGPTLFLVDPSAPGVTREPQTTLDQTRRMAVVTLRDAPGTVVGAVGGGDEAVAKARDVGAVVLAAEAVGGSQRLLDISVEYAKTRLQFGRPIGGFQGVKHRCADMLVAVEDARSTAYHAAWALDDDSVDDARVAVDLATVVTADAYRRVAKDTVQVHGGIGFTWEHPTHLYYKRAASDAALLGGRAAASERLAAGVLDAAS
ncbi:alkylation response protein AidB-like acyl-CoA dehydrogenase [Antricoccus suffuscus]|uniref:Alkylation response protein AidB-like acyl-CoA dehydrogenase n=1 Tax=Antricoccus suffuscus TaxID=1629062 RepID=A0A2T1A4S1_9ACTN|nr:acyl-CoA dehydrogenase family protein [Antricoccus suffuscus]PRZ43328.1 alkylation response protein AidB-like acyl-CoA dehydrogenase [Antricoccus suffuscus]